MVELEDLGVCLETEMSFPCFCISTMLKKKESKIFMPCMENKTCRTIIVNEKKVFSERSDHSCQLSLIL